MVMFVVGMMILGHSIHNGVFMVATKSLDNVNVSKLYLALDNSHLVLLTYNAAFCDLSIFLMPPRSCTHFLWVF